MKQERRNRSRSREKHRKHKKHYKSRSRSVRKNKTERRAEHVSHRSRSKSRRSSEPKQERGKYYKQPPPDPNQIVKELPCFEPSGVLLEYYNSRDGVPLKFHEPPEARIPVDRWRIYPFKGNEPLPPILLINQSSFLLGKDERVCDILLENPSVSRQHCVIQFRQINKLSEAGQYSEAIKPYLLDLQSSNGSFLNGEPVPPSRYVELLPGDRLRFGSSQREYVMLLEGS